MKPKDRIIKVLNREQPDRIPTFEWFIDRTVGKALTGSENPIEIVERLDLDGINIRADYKKEPIDNDTHKDEWGIIRKDTGDCIAAVMESPIPEIALHKEYQFPDPFASHRFDTLRQATKQLGDRRAIILNLRDGFSDMRDLLGYELALLELVMHAAQFKELLDRVVEYNLTLAKQAVQEFDIKIVATTDDIATNTGMLMSPNTYYNVIGPAFQRIIKGYHDLGLKVIKHCDGDCSAVIDFWIDAGIDCLDPIDPGANFKMADFNRQYGDRICLKGNISCTGALEKGTPEEVTAEVKKCLRDGGRRFILSSSNTIHRGVKPENYAAMLETLKKYG